MNFGKRRACFSGMPASFKARSCFFAVVLRKSYSTFVFIYISTAGIGGGVLVHYYLVPSE